MTDFVVAADVHTGHGEIASKPPSSTSASSHNRMPSFPCNGGGWIPPVAASSSSAPYPSPYSFYNANDPSSMMWQVNPFMVDTGLPDFALSTFDQSLASLPIIYPESKIVDNYANVFSEGHYYPQLFNTNFDISFPSGSMQNLSFPSTPAPNNSFSSSAQKENIRPLPYSNIDPTSSSSLVSKIEDYSLAYKDGTKPPYSYASLIAQAILSSQDKKLTLSSIYEWITSQYPYYSNQLSGWQNSIRHNLSLNKCFIKIPRSDTDNGKGAFWGIDPTHLHLFENGYLKKKRIRPQDDMTAESQVSSQLYQSQAFYQHLSPSLHPHYISQPTHVNLRKPRTRKKQSTKGMAKRRTSIDTSNMSMLPAVDENNNPITQNIADIHPFFGSAPLFYNSNMSSSSPRKMSCPAIFSHPTPGYHQENWMFNDAQNTLQKLDEASFPKFPVSSSSMPMFPSLDPKDRILPFS